MQSQSPWQREGEFIVCLLHGERTKLPATCSKCVDDPAPAMNLDDPENAPTTPKGCMSRVQIEIDAVDAARESKRLMHEIAKSKFKRKAVYSYYVKLGELRVKALRLAGEMASTREDDELTNRRLRMLKRMKGSSH